MNTTNPPEFDFFISPSGAVAVAREIAQFLDEAGYCVYCPDPRYLNETELMEAAWSAASRSKHLILLLTADDFQFSLATVLNLISVASSTPGERRLIIVRVETCVAGRLLPTHTFTDLVGVDVPEERRARILAAAEGRPLTLGPGSSNQDMTGELSTEEALASIRKIIADDATMNESRMERIPPRTSPARAYPADAMPSIMYSLPPPRDIVEFAVSHPTSAKRGMPFIVDAWIYRQDDRLLATRRAANLSPENERFRSAGSTELVRGTILTVTLELPWPTEPEVHTVHWNGSITNVSFRVLPVHELSSQTAHGTCNIAVNGLRLGQVFFQIALVGDSVPGPRQVSLRPGAISSAFASYASRDAEIEVMFLLVCRGSKS